MNVDSIIGIEDYYCSSCKKYLEWHELSPNWNCKVCNKLVKIKIDIDKETYSCSRINPNNLKATELVTIDNQYIYEIIAISKVGLIYKIALAGYRTIDCNDGNFITKINGGWYIND